MISITSGIIFFSLACAVYGAPQAGGYGAAPPSGGCPEIGVFGWPHETACDQYYKCENGTFSHEQCPNGLVFDDKSPVYDFCTFYWKVDCGEKTVEPPISTPGCPYRFGIFPSGSCTQYIRCAWGEPNITDCEEGLAYNDDTHSCIWPDQVPGCDSEAIVGFKCPSQLTGLSSKFYPFPRYPHPNDCQKLIVCVNDQPRLLNCGYGSAFNLETYTCDALENVPDCNLRYKK
ncbi:protein obstructor-E-like [Argiope bruennichi]|uniref:protein obstructor-E-like n=1 Tax=Argiope bruennichi TaxID=94029 RepID=UPI0024942B9B|nr:protein obstructor-E-like [Argiope bruennichi]